MDPRFEPNGARARRISEPSGFGREHVVRIRVRSDATSELQLNSRNERPQTAFDGRRHAAVVHFLERNRDPKMRSHHPEKLRVKLHLPEWYVTQAPEVMHVLLEAEHGRQL